MNKFLVWQLIVFLVMMSACKSEEDEKAWCVPVEFLAPSNFVTEPSRDPNYDEPEESAGPTLFFPAQYLSERVSGYQANVESSRSGVLRQPMHVHMARDAFGAKEIDVSRAWRLMEGVPLYSSSARDEFGWAVFVKNLSGDYSFWGECYDDFEGAFTCMRTLAVADDYLTYNVEKVNVRLYGEIDEFLASRVREWRCR